MEIRKAKLRKRTAFGSQFMSKTSDQSTATNSADLIEIAQAVLPYESHDSSGLSVSLQTSAVLVL